MSAHKVERKAMLRGRLKLGLFPFLLLSLLHCAHPQETARIAGPLVVSNNPHYFKDARPNTFPRLGVRVLTTILRNT